MKYLVTDVETGGFEGTSLLTAYFGVLDENFNLIDELELFVRPKDHIYMVTAEALTVNKINLIEHEKKAIPYNEAGTLLFNFLQKYSTIHNYYIPEGTDIKTFDLSNQYNSNRMLKTSALFGEQTIDKLEPLGHNVTFDIIRIKKDLISEGSWLKFVSYRIQDTGTVGNFLKKQGKIPKDISGSLSSYADFFGVDKSKAHDAKGDCMMVVDIYRKMMKL